MIKKINGFVYKITGVVVAVICVSCYSVTFAGSDNAISSTSDLTAVATAELTSQPTAQETPTSSARPNVTKKAKGKFGWSEVDGGVSICNYFGKKKHIVIPEEYQGEKVVEFDPYIGFGEMKTIFIPKTVKRIVADENDCHFSECYKLKAVNVKKENPVYKSVKGMLIDKRNKALLFVPGRAKIRKLIIPKGVKKLHAYSINGPAIKTLIIGKEVKEIHSYALNCRPKTIKIGGGIKVLKANCFERQENIKKLVLKDGIKKIEKRAFADSKKLKKVVIPKSVKYVADNAFPKSCKVIRK